MNAPTWASVHVGDTVRGADQRAWTVVGRGSGTTWLGAGTSEARFALRHDERAVTATRRLHDPVDLIRATDHTDSAAAWGALATHFPALSLLEETVTPADPFTPPAAAPASAVSRDRLGRYRLPDPVTGQERSWTRATTVARTLADEYNLTRWKLRQVAKGLALRPDLVAGAAAADPDADKSTLDNTAEKAMERAGSSSGATLGTALHSFTARLDRGEPLVQLGAPPPLDADLAGYVDALCAHRLRVVEVERVVVVPELGVAGTLDRIVTQPPGEAKAAPRAVLDLKTAKEVSYSFLEIAIQLALYSRAALMWDPATRSYESMPEVDQDRALVLHLPVGHGRGQLYALSLTKGWAYAQLAMAVREARSGAKSLGWLVDPDPAAYALHRVTRAGSREELARLWDQLHPQGLWTEEVNAAAATRMTELSTALATV